MPKLSIIIPVYKVEAYLSKCLDSILHQSFNDFEVILVDDGSPDCCGKICDNFAALDSRFKVIHQNNSGVSEARNTGLRIATGEFIGFIDSDDYLESNALEIIMTNISNYDVLIFGAAYRCPDGQLKFTDFTKRHEYFSRIELFQDLFGLPSMMGRVVWNKVFRRKCIEGISFPKGISYAEDLIYLKDVFERCNTGICIGNILYNMTDRPDSATKNQSDECLYGVINAAWFICDSCYDKDLEIQRFMIEYFLDVCIKYTNQMKANLIDIGQRKHIRKKMIRKICYALNKKILAPVEACKWALLSFKI